MVFGPWYSTGVSLDRKGRPASRLPSRRFALFLLALSALAALTPVARAYEDQLTLGADLGYAARFSRDEIGHEASFGLLSSIGLGNAWSARGRLCYAVELAPDPIHLFLLGSDAVYLVDVVEFVPYAGAGVDGIGTLSGSDFDIDIGIHAALGLDYLLSRSAVAGLEIRPLVVVSRTEDWPFYLFVDSTFSFIFDL
jgi:hypothetical protein